MTSTVLVWSCVENNLSYVSKCSFLAELRKDACACLKSQHEETNKLVSLCHCFCVYYVGLTQGVALIYLRKRHKGIFKQQILNIAIHLYLHKFSISLIYRMRVMSIQTNKQTKTSHSHHFPRKLPPIPKIMHLKSKT